MEVERATKATLLACLVLLVVGGHATAQTWAQDRDRAERKARRDQAVGDTSSAGAEFVKLYGDPAAKAILRCFRDSPQTKADARDLDKCNPGALIEYWRSGRLEQLPDPHAAVNLIAAHGPDALLWMGRNHDQLRDPDAFAAFQAEPLEYIWELRGLEQGAAAARARREAAAPLGAESYLGWLRGRSWEPWAGGALGLAVLFAAARSWRRRREG